MTALTTPATGARDGLLRYAMRLDAVLVGVTGIPFVAAAGWLSSLTGVPVGVEYALGIFFLAYGAVVYWLAGLEHVRPGAIATITMARRPAVISVCKGNGRRRMRGSWALRGLSSSMIFMGCEGTPPPTPVACPQQGLVNISTPPAHG